MLAERMVTLEVMQVVCNISQSESELNLSVGTIKQTLATLHARLRALETENSLCRRRVRELEGELERAKVEVEEAKRDGEHRLREVVGEKSGMY